MHIEAGHPVVLVRTNDLDAPPREAHVSEVTTERICTHIGKRTLMDFRRADGAVPGSRLGTTPWYVDADELEALELWLLQNGVETWARGRRVVRVWPKPRVDRHKKRR